ncbi:MAG: redoxin domain-containing protein [Chlorobiales bacterium]|nr:redoxin domain-containing protein [Chlorobiales bacterium]
MYLVSRAVGGKLKPENVTVTDELGNIISDFDNEFDKAKEEYTLLEYRKKIEEKARVQLLRDIRKGLERIYTPDRIQIVRLNMDFNWDKISEEREEYSPIEMEADNPATPYSERKVKDSLVVSEKSTEEHFQGHGWTPEGPAGTEGDGVCTAGTRACTDGVYGACLGQTLPSIAAAGRPTILRRIALPKCKTSPDFSAVDTQGQKVSLSGLKGKVVLLDFWASWCAPCKQEMPFLIELHKTYKDKGFEVVAVNLDTQEKNMTRFIEQMSVSPEFKILFKVISDPKAQIAGKYKLEGMPTTFLIDRQGHIRYRYTGFHPSKKENYKSDLEQLF